MRIGIVSPFGVDDCLIERESSLSLCKTVFVILDI